MNIIRAMNTIAILLENSDSDVIRQRQHWMLAMIMINNIIVIIIYGNTNPEIAPRCKHLDSLDSPY